MAEVVIFASAYSGTPANFVQSPCILVVHSYIHAYEHSFQLSFENGKMGALTHLKISYRGGYVKVYQMGI